MNESRKGDLFTLSSIALWGAFPIVSKLSLNTFPVLMTAAISTLIAAIFFGVTLSSRNKLKTLWGHQAWKEILGCTLFIGVLYYGFTFYGLAHTTAGNGSIMAMMEIFFAHLLLIFLFKKESASLTHIIGAVLMILGAIIILFPGEWTSYKGDWIILLATIFPIAGNWYMKLARQKTSSEVIMFWRSLLGGGTLLMAALWMTSFPEISAWQQTWPSLLLNGLVLMGFSKLLWIEGIHRIPISRASCALPLEPVIALILAFFFLQEIPTPHQLLGLIPISIGVWLLVKK